MGALLGYVDGFGVGLLYGVVAPRIPRPLAGIALGLTAMAGGDATSTVLGVTDPRTWSRSAWLSDLVPHLIYGVVVAYTFDRLGRF